MNYHHHHLGKSKILERSWKDILGYQQNDRHGWSCHVSLQVDIYTPKPGFVSPWVHDTVSSVWEHDKYIFSPGPLRKPCSFCQGFQGDARSACAGRKLSTAWVSTSAGGELGTLQHWDIYTRAVSSQIRVPGLLTSKRSRQIRRIQWDLMLCSCSVEKRGELWAPEVVVEIYMWDRYHGNLGCYPASLFHREGECFSDDCMSPVFPVDLHIHYKCFAGRVSWKSEVVLLHRNPWTSLSHSMQYFIFPGTSLWVCLHCSYQSAAWLWSHLSLPCSERVCGV